MNYNLPDGYCWRAGKGLVKERGKREEVICDCIPVNIKRYKLFFERTQEEKEGCSFYLLSAEGDTIGANDKPFVCTKEELVSSKFMNIISSDMIFEPKNGVKEETRRVFEYIIKKSCKNQTPEYSYQYEFGWNGKFFCWMKELEITTGKEYANAIRICGLFTDTCQIPAAILASVHGILEKLLQDAGIWHNFVTYFVGTTGVGKSALLRAVCNYYTKTGNLFTVGSDHKSIKKVMEGGSDMTIILDDFCKTKSERVSSSQLQIVSEVIQASSDAARILVDEDSIDRADRQARHHVVISAEQVVNNESTMNRCFLVRVTDTLPEKIFSEIKDMEKDRVFYEFLVSFSKYLSGENYTDIVAKAEANYRSYSKNIRRLGECTKGSDNRINNTYAVQMVIAQILMDYFIDLKIMPDLLSKVRNSLESNISETCRNLKQDIMALHNQETHKTYLEPLAEIIIDMDVGKDRGLSHYRLARSEERYRQKNKPACDAFCIRNGYVSFDGRHMCRLIESNYGVEGANPRGLSSDLQYYSLAHADNEGKLSCRWGTKGRYYHVRVAELLALIVPDLDDMLCERVNAVFER